MPHGGRRPGAGRRPGSQNKRTIELLAKVEAFGLTPLDVMLETMRDHWIAGRKDQAAAVAKDAAPYVHPKLTNVDARIDQHTTHHVGEDYRERILLELARQADAGDTAAGDRESDTATTH